MSKLYFVLCKSMRFIIVSIYLPIHPSIHPSMYHLSFYFFLLILLRFQQECCYGSLMYYYIFIKIWDPLLIFLSSFYQFFHIFIYLGCLGHTGSPISVYLSIIPSIYSIYASGRREHSTSDLLWLCP